MKIVYCIHSLYNPGGMERVLLNKVRYFVEQKGWEIVIFTTDQHNRPTFYPLPEGVRMVDLGINYSDDNRRSPLGKIVGYLKRRRRHRRSLAALLNAERPDITVSLFPCESSFIPSLKDGSKKVLEIHYSKFFRLQYGRHGLLRLIDRYRTHTDERLAQRFDRFVVLTHEDCGYWPKMANIEVIPNAALFRPASTADLTAKHVVAVGRLDHQKGFDRMLDVWAELLQTHPDLSDWTLDIYGQGEWHDNLLQQAEHLGISSSVVLHAPTKDIEKVYTSSAFLLMTSRYEGFPMVMIEAMACGLPVISYDFKTGPRDIIRLGDNGYFVTDGDSSALVAAMANLMNDLPLRQRLGKNALRVRDTFSETSVMDKWTRLFEDLAENR